MPYTYSIFTFFIGALATLKISSSTQSPYLPCCMSWFFSSTRLCKSNDFSLLSTYKCVFFSLIPSTILSWLHCIIKAIHPTMVKILCGRNGTIDIDFSLRALYNNGWLFSVCKMVVLSIPCGLVLCYNVIYPEAHK